MAKYKILYIDELDTINGFEVGEIVEGQLEIIFNAYLERDIEYITIYNEIDDETYCLYKEQVEEIID